ncbi:MAG: hypothetical protein CSA76_00235 [Spirochaetales bacterium]|nr:MAG: hypothetical protein CSA76_00235 [Spirochaetales bacterium]
MYILIVRLVIGIISIFVATYSMLKKKDLIDRYVQQKKYLKSTFLVFPEVLIFSSGIILIVLFSMQLGTYLS